MIEAAIAILLLAGGVATVRLLQGPGLADRIVALDVTLVCFMGAIAAYAALEEDTTYLIVLVVLAIIGFTATVSAARFLQHEDTLPELRTDNETDRKVETIDGVEP